MLRYVLDYIKDGVAMYSYMPEGDEGRVGHVGIVMLTGECVFEELAPQDGSRTYALMMAQRLRKFQREGSFDESGLVAWC